MTKGTEYRNAVFAVVAIAIAAALLVMAAPPLMAETTQSQLTVANGELPALANDCVRPMTVELCKKCCVGYGEDCLVNCGMGIASNWSNSVQR